MSKDQGTKKGELVSEQEFQKVLKKVLGMTKEKSDRQLAEFQASNKVRREEKKPKG